MYTGHHSAGALVDNFPGSGLLMTLCNWQAGIFHEKCQDTPNSLHSLCTYYEQKLTHWKYSDDQHPPAVDPIYLDCPEQTQVSPVIPPNTKIKPATVVYSLSIHHKFDHFADWMDVMWEPQHFYIIHVDSKSTEEFYNQVLSINFGWMTLPGCGLRSAIW